MVQIRVVWRRNVLVVLTDVSTTLVEVFMGVKWRVFVSWVVKVVWFMGWSDGQFLQWWYLLLDSSSISLWWLVSFDLLWCEVLFGLLVKYVVMNKMVPCALYNVGSDARSAQDMVIWRDIVKALAVPLGTVRLSVCCQLLLKSVVFNRLLALNLMFMLSSLSFLFLHFKRCHCHYSHDRH